MSSRPLPSPDAAAVEAGSLDWTNQDLAALEREIERLGRSDGLNGVPVNRDDAGELRFEREHFGVGLDDCAGQAVAVFECYLVG